MKTIRVKAESALRKAAEDMKWYYDRERGPLYHFKVGDRVWLEAMHISSDRPMMKKLDDRRYGPFKIISKHGESAFKLDLPKTWEAVYPLCNEVHVITLHHCSISFTKNNPRPYLRI